MVIFRIVDQDTFDGGLRFCEKIQLKWTVPAESTLIMRKDERIDRGRIWRIKDPFSIPNSSESLVENLNKLAKIFKVAYNYWWSYCKV